MIKDFNKEFWNIWGITGKRRIYTYEDVFKLKSSWRESLKRNFFKFINKEKLSNKTFFQILYNEPNNFYLLFNNLVKGNEDSLFYVKELNNITYTFKFCEIFNLEDNKVYIDLISFQVAYIVEHMKYSKIDIKLFDETMKSKSLNHYIEQLKIKKNKNIYGISRELASVHNNILKDIEGRGYKTAIKKMTEDKNFGSTFEKDISNWNKGKLPEFLKLIVLSVALFESYPKEERFISFLLLLMSRSLLYIREEYKINKEIEDMFVNRYNFFRKELNPLFKNKDYKEIVLLQKKYCINFEKILEESFDELYNEINNEINVNINIMMQHISTFFENKIDDLNIDKTIHQEIKDYVKRENIKFHY